MTGQEYYNSQKIELTWFIKVESTWSTTRYYEFNFCVQVCRCLALNSE